MSSETTVPAAFREPGYRARRAQNWVLVGLLYSFFYMSRYNFTALAPMLRDIFGWTKGDLGVFETLLPLVYGLSVVINAPLADRIGGRRAFLLGAAGVVVMNTIFGLFSLVVVSPGHYQWAMTPREMAWTMAIVWAVNGYFQSFGALSIVKINAQWFHLRERGTFAAIFGVLIRLGLVLGFSGAPYFASHFGWQWGFFAPAAFVALLFVLNWLFVRETPVEAGFEELDTGDAQVEGGPRPTVGAILGKVFASPTMWMIALSSMMIGLIRRSVVDAWWPLYLKETFGVTSADTAYQVTSWGIAVAGIIGGFTVGIMSDRVFDGRRAPVVTLGFVGMLAALGAFYLTGVLGLGPVGAVASLLGLSFFINGAHGMIGGAASMDFGGRKAAATAAGLFDGMQYLAAAVTGPVVPWLTTNHGWDVWKLWPMPFALIGALVMSRLWNVRPGGRAH
jgi:OPA family glycerol-3-phosphate transporter-like MFS transporter